MKRILLFLMSCLVVFSFAGCNPNDEETATINNPTGTISDAEFAKNFGAAAQRDFIGQVVDRNDEPIAGASVKIGSSTVLTDTHGVFIVNAANVYERFAYITATKAGYVNGSRSMVPTSGKNKVRIMLIPTTPVQTIASGASATVNLPNGTQVVFDGAFADESGNAYSGNVSVSMFHLESSDANLRDLMPGMLYARTDEGESAVLETFGMMNVELRGSGGQKLQIASGHKAEISMKIDNAQLATASETIPLWHFDEINGYWKEEGFATKEGNKYVGEVSHFSWWNCDAPFPTVCLNMHIVNQLGIPLSNTIVTLSAPPTISERGGYTSSDGWIGGLVPKGVPIVLKVIVTGPCGNTTQFTQTIGPFLENTTLSNFVVTLNNEPDPQVHIRTISGRLVKCDNSAVTNGYALIVRPGPDLVCLLGSNGDFSYTVSTCQATAEQITVYGFDLDVQSLSQPTNHNFNQNISLGNVSCCNSVGPGPAPQNTILYQIDGNPVVTITPASSQVSTFGTLGSLSAFNNIGELVFNLYYSGFQNAGADGSINNISINGMQYTPMEGAVISAEFISFGGLNQYLTGSVSGIFKDSQQVLHNISVSFNILDLDTVQPGPGPAPQNTILYQVDGNPVVTVTPASSQIGLFGMFRFMNAFNTIGEPVFNIYYSGFQSVGATGSINSIAINGNQYTPMPNTVLSAQFTSFGGLNQYLTGSVSGVFKDSQQIPHNISVSFNILDID